MYKRGMERAEREVASTFRTAAVISGVIFEKQWNAWTSRNSVTGSPEGVLSTLSDKVTRRVLCGRRLG